MSSYRVKELNTATTGNSDSDSDKKMEVDEADKEESLSADVSGLF